MALQFPAPTNQLSLPAIDNAVSRSRNNALVNDAQQMQNESTQRGMDRDQATEAGKFMLGLGKLGQESLQQDPEWYQKNYEQIKSEFQSRGMPTDKIPQPGTVDTNQLMQDFAKLQEAGQMALMGQAKEERYEDVLGPEGNLVGQRSSTTNEYTDLQRGGSGGNARLEYFSELSTYAEEVDADGKPTPRARQAQVALGTEARAGMSADERIANDPGLTDRVSESQSQIRESVKFAEMQGSQRSQYIDSGYQMVLKLDQNLRNISKGIDALSAGANTGYIESTFFPNIKAATIELSQIQNLLGLDVIGSVTFGALSKGELDLALETALPTDLQEEELKEWLIKKQAAQTKLRKYFRDQMDHLDQGGSVSSFLRERERTGNKEVMLQEARDAIAKGATQEVVEERLRSNGIDPGEL